MTLIGALEPAPALSATGHETLLDVRRILVEAIEPAARRVFGAPAASAWLVPCWRALAQQAAALPFEAGHSDAHAAPLWLRAGDWPAARRAVESIGLWHRMPAPLAWMTEARYRAEGLDETWPLLAELAWLSPATFAELLDQLGDTSLNALRHQFDAQFDGDGTIADFAWFPAWLLTVKPALMHRLREAQQLHHVDPERATSLLWQILSLEHQGRHHAVLQRRQALRDMHAGLYAAYLRTR